MIHIRRRRSNSMKSQPETDYGIINEDFNMEEIHNQQDEELKKYAHNSDFIFASGYDFIIYGFKFIYKIIRFVIRISGIYLLWIFLHYLASHLYIKLCVPYTVVGFLMSPFMTATPHCQGLRWIVYNAASVINNMWIVLGAWICSTILVTKREGSNEGHL